jgi:hypothetical protein
MLPAPARLRSFGRNQSDTGAVTVDCTGLTSAIRKWRNSGQRLAACAVLERRIPVLLFRLSFLFRFEQRVFLALLFQEPPRTQRFGHRPAKNHIVQQS